MKSRNLSVTFFEKIDLSRCRLSYVWSNTNNIEKLSTLLHQLIMST